jgi:prevent-host-death family protein
MTTAPLTEARDRLSEIIDDVGAGASAWVITKHGRPVAVIMSHDEYESLIETLNVLSDPDTMAALGEAEEDLAAGRVGPL